MLLVQERAKQDTRVHFKESNRSITSFIDDDTSKVYARDID